MTSLYALIMPAITHAADPAASATASVSTLDQTSRDTMAILERHSTAVATQNADLIAADYSDNVTLFVSFVPKPIVGQAAFKQFLVDLFDTSKGETYADKMFRDIPGGKPTQSKMLRREAHGNYAYQIVDFGNATLTETYVIENGKVVLETVTLVPKETLSK